MLSDYGAIALFLIVAILFSATTIALPVALRYLGVIPHHMNPVKTATYECGLETIGETWIQFNFRYYFYALIFVALDIMVVFIYPWAVGLRGLGASGLAVILVFAIIVLVGYIYAWRKRVLEWK